MEENTSGLQINLLVLSAVEKVKGISPQQADDFIEKYNALLVSIIDKPALNSIEELRLSAHDASKMAGMTDAETREVEEAYVV